MTQKIDGSTTQSKQLSIPPTISCICTVRSDLLLLYINTTRIDPEFFYLCVEPRSTISFLMIPSGNYLRRQVRVCRSVQGCEDRVQAQRLFSLSKPTQTTETPSNPGGKKSLSCVKRNPKPPPRGRREPEQRRISGGINTSAL